MKKYVGILLFLSLLLTAIPTLAQEGESYYVSVTTAKLRETPSTKATVLEKLVHNDLVIVIEVVEGTKVSGSKIWYKVSTGKNKGYIHSSLVTKNAPIVIATIVPARSANSGRPDNCDQARAWGLTAEEAGKWSHLDRDGDGVACYGD